MDQSAYYHEHPPRCTRGFTTSVAKLKGVSWDGHGEELNPVFALSCRCGSRLHKIHGYRWRNPDFNNVEVVLSPIELSCTTCGARTLLIDTGMHGYDSELGNGSATVRAEGTPTEVQCKKCTANSFETYIRFEYPEDLFDGEFDDFPGGKEDLFTWVTIAAYCAQCGSVSTPVEFECAQPGDRARLLQPGQRYFWSFRAGFKLGGQPMVTRWASFRIESCNRDMIPEGAYYRFVTPEERK